ncbi:ATP-dependent protease ATPase subunit HslU [Candidatus Chlorohelix sp.]|uniref:ATP-dependent protease ATPase subunit HslU n=1 Tax=Candidatus Chlorohelix sp. TaxID=3139201 RepID=UPI003075477C
MNDILKNTQNPESVYRPPELTTSITPLADLTPPQIVAELDRFIVGQDKAKRAVAIALRNRYRRLRLSEELREEIAPKNIMMIGPTGVGKTEIARRVAKIIDAPFIKVEATKFTEVGYVGRDVESIIRDLLEASIQMVREEKLKEVNEKAEVAANEKLVNYLVLQLYYKDKDRKKPAELEKQIELVEGDDKKDEPELSPEEKRRLKRRRRHVANMLNQKKLEEQTIEIDLDHDGSFGGIIEFVASMGTDEHGDSFPDFMESLGSLNRRRTRRLSVKDARRVLINEEAHKLIDFDEVVDEALRRSEQMGVVFLDEIDKIVGNGNETGPDVSGEGVQRDLLPIVEGSTVMTRYGSVRSDHILFIAAGAFHNAKPSDLIPELQGRFPLRVELDSLDKEDLKEILVKPHNSLTHQYIELLATEGVNLTFEDDGLDEIAYVASEVNRRNEDIGARRLHTVMERVLEEISFCAAERKGDCFVVNREYVQQQVGDLVEDEDLSRYIL